MDQTTTAPTTEQPQGKIFLRVNKRKQQGDNLPAFTGDVSIPGTEQRFDVALWGSEYADKDTGEMKKVFNGRTSITSSRADAEAQLDQLVAAGSPVAALTENNLTLEAGQLVLFENKFKDEAEARADGHVPNRPDFYGRWNPGNGQKMVSISAWAGKSKQRFDFGNVVLTGFSQYPMPGKERDISADAETPAPRAARSRKRNEAEASMDR